MALRWRGCAVMVDPALTVPRLVGVVVRQSGIDGCPEY
jgi:hypothetical protein